MIRAVPDALPLLAHDVRGARGPAVLFLHAGVADRRMWDAQWEALAPGRRLVRCDLRGFGGSPVPHRPWSNAQDVVALLEHLRMARVCVIGASYGGLVALQVAGATHRVNRLVLLNPAYDDLTAGPDLEAFVAAEDELLAAGDVDGAVDLNVRTWLGPAASDRTRADLAGWQRSVLDLQLAAPDVGPAEPPVSPRRLTQPTTVVTGAHDLAHMRAVADDLAAQLPCSRLVDLGWAGHLPSLERPDAMTALVVEALAGDPGPSDTGPSRARPLPRNPVAPPPLTRS